MVSAMAVAVLPVFAYCFANSYFPLGDGMNRRYARVQRDHLLARKRNNSLGPEMPVVHSFFVHVSTLMAAGL